VSVERSQFACFPHERLLRPALPSEGLVKRVRECVASLDLSSVFHTGVEPRWRLLLENDFAGGRNESNLIAVSTSVPEPRSCLPSKHGKFL
jgi:hypothetical protein